MTSSLAPERHDRSRRIVVTDGFQPSGLGRAKHPQRHMQRPASKIDAHYAIADFIFGRPIDERAKIRQTQSHPPTSRDSAGADRCMAASVNPARVNRGGSGMNIATYPLLVAKGGLSAAPEVRPLIAARE